MSQTSEMGIKRGAKKPSGQMPPEQGPAPSAGPSAGPTHSGPVVVDLDSSPVSRKRKADIPPDDLEQLSRAGIRVARTVPARSLLDGVDDIGNESSPPLGAQSAGAVSSPPVQPFGVIRSGPDPPVHPSPSSQAHSEAGQPSGSDPRSSQLRPTFPFLEHQRWAEGTWLSMLRTGITHDSMRRIDATEIHKRPALGLIKLFEVSTSNHLPSHFFFFLVFN